MKAEKSVLFLFDHPAEAAKAADLVYVNDTMPGITRMKKGKGWSYRLPDGKICRDGQTLLRIKSLVIPPAWKNVWICAKDNGHLQATGIDALGRKQYKYHPQWISLRNETKFYRMLQFGQLLPLLRQQVDKDLRTHELSERRVVALIIYLMDRTAIRIGNTAYKKMYGSFGLTTLHDKHVKISGSKLKISFRGKKGIQQDIEVNNSRLARIIQKCRDIPGQELFQYYDDAGNIKKVDSGMVNHYISEVTGETFTAKDFRTWKASVYAVRVLSEKGDAEVHPAKKDLVDCFTAVSKKLGNSRSICKKYYVHPLVVSTYENGNLPASIAAAEKRTGEDEKFYRNSEAVLMHILEKENRQYLRRIMPS